MCFLIRNDSECWRGERKVGSLTSWRVKRFDFQILRFWSAENNQKRCEHPGDPIFGQRRRFSNSRFQYLQAWNSELCSKNINKRTVLSASVRLSVRVLCETESQLNKRSLKARENIFCKSIENFSVSGKLGRKIVFLIN